MSFETDRNPPPLPMARISTATSLLQAGLLLAALAGIMVLALWPGLGGAAIVVALLTVGGIVALARRAAPATWRSSTV
jgi:hypothetical protein